MTAQKTELRNVAIIAHVDHGKTTLVDELLKQSGAIRSHQQMDERAMDSNDLEKERGITILAKATSVEWNGIRFNIVDTPGHADFGGEVERILSMVDGAVVLVDSAEGPMPQTKFVVGKAGWMADSPEGPKDKGLVPLFELIAKHVPAPEAKIDEPFAMIGTLLEADNFLGRLITGRVSSGIVKPNQTIKVLDGDGKLVEQGRVSKILAYRGLERVAIDEGVAGDIITIAGLPKGTVAETFCDVSVDAPLEAQPVDPPTVTMSFIVNDSPYAGTEGDKVTSRVIRDRLMREAEGNVALKIEESDDKDSFYVSGRGELQLSVLIETMRREGFEIAVSRPRVVMQKGENGEKLEPVEEVVIDVDEEHGGIVVQKMAERKAEMIELKPSGGDRQRLVFHAPTRGLIGYLSELLTDTRGTAVMNRIFHGFEPYKGAIQGRVQGVLLSNDTGSAAAYALFNLEDRGPMVIDAGEKVYQGMIVGIHTRGNDLEVNVLKGKKLTNMRASGKDDAVKLTPPIKMTLERALSWIQDDELVEVTPKTMRLRKVHLDPVDRKRLSKSAAA